VLPLKNQILRSDTYVLTINLVAILGFAFFDERKASRTVRFADLACLRNETPRRDGLGWDIPTLLLTGDKRSIFLIRPRESRALQNEPGSVYFDFLWQDPDPEWKGAARSVFL